jgi:hypothetical protein
MDIEDKQLMLINFLVKQKKTDKKFAEESFNVINDTKDTNMAISIIMFNFLMQKDFFCNETIMFQNQISIALNSVFSSIDQSLIPTQFQELFKLNQEKNAENILNNKKLNFAVHQFVSAYLEYDIFEKKYPKLINKL